MLLMYVGGTIHNGDLSIDVIKPISFLEELSMILDYINILIESECVPSVLFIYQLFIPIH